MRNLLSLVLDTYNFEVFKYLSAKEMGILLMQVSRHFTMQLEPQMTYVSAMDKKRYLEEMLQTTLAPWNSSAWVNERPPVRSLFRYLLSVADSMTLLHVCAHGWNDIVEQLLQKGITLPASASKYRFVEYRHMSVVETLLGYGLDPSKVLRAGCFLDDTDLVDLAFRHNAVFNGSDLVFLLGTGGSHRVLSFLLQRQCLTEEETYDCFAQSCYRGHHQAVQVFIDHGVDVQFNDNQALMVACSYPKATFVADLLLSTGADPYARNGQILQRLARSCDCVLFEKYRLMLPETKDSR